MNSDQNRKLSILSSTLVGIMAFCVAICMILPLALIGGAILLDSQQGYAFFSPQDAVLFLISILVGLAVAVFVGRKYYRYKEKRVVNKSEEKGAKRLI